MAVRHAGGHKVPAGVIRPLSTASLEHTLTGNIEQPLGQTRPPRQGGALVWLRGLPLGGIAAAAMILGTSGLIATRDDGLRRPVRETVSVPETAASAIVPPPSVAQPPADVLPTAPPVDAPSIIRLGESAPSDNIIVIRDPAALSRNSRTAHIPDRALIEESDSGPLPIRAADGRRPFDVYAGAWSGSRGAKVAIVIGGLGLSQTGTQSAIKALPAEVTLGFASQGNSLTRWMEAARRAGHEILIQVPLEPFDYPKVDPGRNTLTVDASPEENLESLRWALSRTTNYTGVMNHMGGRFVAEPAAMAPVMQDLGRRGLLYLDDGTSARSVAPDLALASAVPFAAGDAVIDSARDRGSILKKLDQLEATARARGSAIGIGSAFDMTVDTVASWVNEAKKRGIEIVPVSAIASDPERGR